MVLALKPEGAQFGWLRQDPSRRLEAAGGSQVGEPQKGIISMVPWQEMLLHDGFQFVDLRLCRS